MAQLTESEIKALITLLADEDERTSSVARRVLLESRDRALPFLQTATQSPDALVRGRVRTLLDTIRLEDLEDRFRLLADETDAVQELETGCLLVAEYAYPDLDVAHYQDVLSDMAADLSVLLTEIRDPHRVLSTMAEYLSRQKRLRGDDRYFQDPDASYLNRVLDRGIGIPISLSAVYLLVGQRLNLPVYGVGLPGHFVVKWEDPNGIIFVDPYNEGRFLSLEECRHLVEESGHPFRESYLRAVSPRQMLTRMLTNLIWAYEQANDPVAARQMARFRSILLSGRRRPTRSK